MSDDHELAMALRAAYWAMHRQTDALLAPHGVTADQFVLMALLADGDGITQQTLVQRASSDANTVRAMLVLLEERGLVSRRPHPTDGRARSVILTAKGRRMYADLCAATDPFRRELMAAVGDEQATLLIDGLNRLHLQRR